MNGNKDGILRVCVTAVDNNLFSRVAQENGIFLKSHITFHNYLCMNLPRSIIESFFHLI